MKGRQLAMTCPKCHQRYSSFAATCPHCARIAAHPPQPTPAPVQVVHQMIVPPQSASDLPTRAATTGLFAFLGVYAGAALMSLASALGSCFVPAFGCMGCFGLFLLLALLGSLGHH